MTIVYDNSTILNGTDTGAGNGSFNTRIRIRAIDLASFAGGANIAITCQFGSACPTETGSIASIWVGREATTLQNFTGDQVQLLTGGVAAVDGAAGKIFTTDVTALGSVYDNTKDLLIAFFCKVGSNASFSFANLAANHGGYFFDNAGHGDTGSSTVPTGTWDTTSEPVSTSMFTKIDITGAAGAAILPVKLGAGPRPLGGPVNRYMRAPISGLPIPPPVVTITGGTLPLMGVG